MRYAATDKGQLTTDKQHRTTVKSQKLKSVLFYGQTGLLLLCLLLGMGCGLKAPPVPPGTITPPNILDLDAKVAGDTVRLTWALPKKKGVVFPGLKHFRIYRYKAPISDELCAGCPIPFERFLDIRLDDPAPARVEEGRMIWVDEVEPGHRYAYMITVHHESGGVSKASNIVQFVTGEKTERTNHESIGQSAWRRAQSVKENNAMPHALCPMRYALCGMRHAP